MMKNKMLFDLADETQDSIANLPLGKDEMNFAEFPIALLTDKVPKGQKVIKFEDQIFDEKRKRVITRRRIIEGSEEYGLPTATDDRVILALIQITKTKGDFTHREVEFSRLELIRMLGWADEGRSYDRIKLSLLRIKAVNYVYDNAWYDKRQKMWTTRAFSIIDNVEINDSRTNFGQGGLFTSRILWNEVVFESFQSGFLRDIDFRLCMQLEHPTALRMYRFLGKRFYHKPEWVFDLQVFANDHMCLGRNYEGGAAIARKLKPAVAELEEVGFLEPLSEDKRFIKKGREWSICFIQKAPQTVLPPASAEQVASQPSGVAEALISRGVTAKIAEQLVKQFPAAIIHAKLEEFDWEMTQPKSPKRPAGYLVKSIRDGYKADPKFISTAERQRREEAQQAKKRQDAVDVRRQREEDAREKAIWKKVAAYWDSLTPEQQVEIQVSANALVDPAELAMEREPLKRMSQKIRREHYIRKLLEIREEATLPA